MKVAVGILIFAAWITVLVMYQLGDHAECYRACHADAECARVFHPQARCVGQTCYVGEETACLHAFGVD